MGCAAAKEAADEDVDQAKYSAGERQLDMGGCCSTRPRVHPRKLERQIIEPKRPPPGTDNVYKVQSSHLKRTDKEGVFNQYLVVSDELLGKGFQSRVYLVKHKKSKVKYALKVLDTKRVDKMASKATKDSELFATDEDGGDIWIEVAVAQRVRHANIVHIHEVLNDAATGQICLVMELMDRPLPKNKKIKPDKARMYSRDLVAGLSALHMHGVVHRDIKVDNCLVNREGVTKLADFGLAHLIERRRSHDQSWDDTLRQGIGSRKYRAPEIFEHDCYSGFKADVWCATD
eukprot:SAG31_NODE_1806_length_7230_cov_40.014164_2_plen_288_part_00